jgi:hypothetical protein
MDREVNLIFDLETDGFLKDVTTIHCLSIYDLDTKETYSYNDTGNQEPVVRGVQRLKDANTIIGHNIIGYDIPVIRKLFSWFNSPSCVIDTLLLSRLYHPDILKVDKKHEWKHMPLKLYGRHSLESYGYRLGEFKGSFGASTDWKNWSQEMEDYCTQDVHVTTKLWKHFTPYLNGSR